MTAPVHAHGFDSQTASTKTPPVSPKAFCPETLSPYTSSSHLSLWSPIDGLYAMPLPASGCTTPDLSTKSGLICVKSALESISIPNSNNIISVYLGIRPRKRHPHTCRREVRGQQIQVVLKTRNDRRNLRTFPVFHYQRHHPIAIPRSSATCRLSRVPFDVLSLHKNSIDPRRLTVHSDINNQILLSREGLIIVVRNGTHNVRRIAMLADTCAHYRNNSHTP